ncbi:LacI family DNA-binding transcriptional regulator [Deinococcus sp.]|uniref:LacI family DNA-binding transcriptional regulator n=1 Tax=Deinococcus sp. TaxID=47478 RepID=UPI003B5A8F5C
MAAVPSKKVNIKDVARHAGVQPSTVSRALNDHPEVSAVTRAHVLRSIQELGYVPDRAAKRFRSGKTHSISLILPITSSAFYNRLIDSIDEALEIYDYDAGIFPLLSERRLARYQDPSALPYHTDGLVFASLNPDHLYRSLLTIQGVPAVVLDIRTPNFDHVVVNNELGGALAAQHLRLRPAPTLVMSVEERFETPFASGVFQERLRGFTAAQHAAGLGVAPEHLFTTEFTLPSARATARQMLQRCGGPVNIFATCDFFAYALIEEARLAGRSLGGEVRIVGFDDEPHAQELGLSTLRQPVEALGQTLVRLLMERLETPGLPIRSVEFDPVLQVRRTS